MSLRTHFVSDWQDVKTDVKYSVLGIYDTKMDIDLAIEKLKEQGFQSKNISVLVPDKVSSGELFLEKKTKTTEGATTGATTGAVLGGTLGWLIGVGVFTVESVGPFIAAGPLLSAIAGIILGGVLGALTGALVGFAIPAAKKFENKVKAGGIVLSVQCDDSDWVNRANKLLEITGAQEISSIYLT